VTPCRIRNLRRIRPPKAPERPRASRRRKSAPARRRFTESSH
jgi:hypothetical protein